MPRKALKPARWANAVQSPEAQFESKRQALLREAGRAFSRHGFHDTSLDEIAAVLGVTKPALYYYFKTKHDILFACHTVAMDLGDRAQAIAEREGQDGLAKLRIFVVHYLDLLTSELGACAVLTEHNAMRAADREVIQTRRRAFDRWLRGLVQEGIADGSVAPCDPRLAISLLMGSVNSVHRWFSPDGPMSGAEIGEAIARQLALGFSPRPEAAHRPSLAGKRGTSRHASAT